MTQTAHVILDNTTGPVVTRVNASIKYDGSVYVYVVLVEQRNFVTNHYVTTTQNARHHSFDHLLYLMDEGMFNLLTKYGFTVVIHNQGQSTPKASDEVYDQDWTPYNENYPVP